MMIEKFARIVGKVQSELLDLNHTSKYLLLVPLKLPKFAPEPSREYRRTSVLGHE